MNYKPYKSDKPDKKYFIVTSSGKKVYFGAAGYEDYTTHKDPERKEAYIRRHKKNEQWDNPDTAGYWAFQFLWSYPTKEEAYKHIKIDLKRKGYK